MANSGVGSVEVELSNNRDIDGILWGHRWANPNLTYSFPTSIGEYVGYEGITGFSAFTNTQSAAVNAIVANFNAVCGLNITYTSGTGANLRFAEATVIDYSDQQGQNPHRPGAPLISAEGNPPDPFTRYDYAFGDMWFNPGLYETPVAGGFTYAAGLMHELGHAVGLAHGHLSQVINHFTHQDMKPPLPANRDSQEFSIMTYRVFVGGPFAGIAAPADYPQSLMQNDIAALQYISGADFTHLSGDTVYSWNTSTGAMSIDGVAGATPAKNNIFLTIWDGGGNDTYDFSNYGINSYLVVDLNPGGWTDVDSDSNFQAADLNLNAPGTQIARGQVFNALLYNGDVRSLIENAIGGRGDDTITGNAAANTLTGNAGNDTLNGNDGFDRFEGGSGADALDGGEGIDQAQYTFALSGVTVDLISPSTNTGEATGDTFISIENLRGTNFNDVLRGDNGNNVIGGLGGGGADTLAGRGGDDYLAGGDGNDSLDGGTGSDRLEGGIGDDTYFIGDVLDVLIENVASGLDTVQSTVSWSLGANFEDLVLNGFANISGAGNTLANRLFGNFSNNTLNGLGAYDSLGGGGGNDTYVLGDLTFFSALTGFIYDGVTEEAGAGIDTIVVTSIDDPDTVSSIDGYTLGANVENGTIAGNLAFNLTGNALANRLTGNGAVNVLTGGESGDTYVLTSLAQSGGLGAWRYDSVVETGTTGIDSVIVTAEDNPDTFTTIETYTLGSTIEYGTIAGTLAFNLTGNALANRLTGNSAVNILTGGEGGDTYVLTSLAQSGGLGTWRYDSVVETGTTGIDSVIVTALDNPGTASTVDGYLLGATIENGIIAGTLAFNLTGNGFANSLTGNSGDNTLTGGLGRDVLTGGAGFNRFDFNAITESGTTTSTIDVVTDFKAATGSTWIDRIDVSTIDANSTIAGNQAFVFGGAFLAGHIQAIQSGANVFLQFNTDADAAAEMIIRLNNVLLANLNAGDFYL